MVWHLHSWANTPVMESVSRLSHPQHSICAGCATGFRCVRVTQEIEQAMSKKRKAISNQKEEQNERSWN